MVDDFKTEIRERMGQSSFAEGTELVFPVEGYALNRTPTANLVAIGLPLIYEMVGRTVREGEEQGAVAWVPPSTIDPQVTEIHVSEIVRGFGGSSVTGQTVQPDAPIFYNMHTHPIGSSASLSRADITSMLGSILQYPESARTTLSRNPTRRSFGVIAQPFGYPDDEVLVKLVTVGSGVLDLSIGDQTALTKEIIAAWEDRSTLTPLDDFLSQFADFFTVSTEQVKLPVEARKLRFRSAIPDSVSDEAWGQAFSKGDLRPLLRGVEYI